MHGYSDPYLTHCSELIESVWYMKGLHERSIKELVLSLRLKNYEKGQSIVEQGDEAKGIMFVLEGEV